MARKNILKEAGVVLITALLVLTAIVVVPLKAIPLFSHDVGVTAIISPTTGPMQTYPVEVTVYNFGTNAETGVPVEVVIEKKGVTVYDATVSIDINAGQSMNVFSPDWYPSGTGEYQVTACTQLSSDQNTSNDCLTVFLYIVINIFGFDHIALGDAALDVVNNTLVVSNIGSSGNDGVDISIPNNFVNCETEISGIRDPINTSDGAYFEVTTKGIIDGNPNQIASVYREEKQSYYYNISISFTNLNPKNLTACYYLAGNLVFKEEGIDPNGPFKKGPTWKEVIAAFKAVHGDVSYSRSVHKEYDPDTGNLICKDKTCTADASVGTGASNVSTPQGNIVFCDKIAITAYYCTSVLESLTNVELTAADLPSSSFTIHNESATFNQPPNTPNINGTANGKIRIKYDYTFVATDPNEDKLDYYIDWGDGTNSSWVGPYASGETVIKNHTWSEKGTYAIKVKVEDDFNESAWNTLTVSMPFSYNIPMLRFWDKLFERFPNAFPILRHLMGY